jgi:hypothetical protein
MLPLIPSFSFPKAIMKRALLGLLAGASLGIIIVVSAGRALLPYSVYLVGTIAGVIFLVVFFRPKQFAYPRLMRTAFLILGFSLLIWALLGVTLSRLNALVTPHANYRLHIIDAYVGGIGLGMLLLVMISGELFKRREKEGKEGSVSDRRLGG